MMQKNITPNKRHMFYCEPCGFKKIVDVNEQPNLVEIKTSPIQGKIPILDPTTGKVINTWMLDPKTETVVNAQMKLQPKKYKCPNCGRGVKLRELIKPFADALSKRDEEATKRQLEEEKIKRLEDGKPPEKKVDPEFMG